MHSCHLIIQSFRFDPAPTKPTKQPILLMQCSNQDQKTGEGSNPFQFNVRHAIAVHVYVCKVALHQARKKTENENKNENEKTPSSASRKKQNKTKTTQQQK
jgi:hypothetical protein